MGILALLIAVSLGIGTFWHLAFLWSLKGRQYEDPEGDGARILTERRDDRPAPVPPLCPAPPAAPPASTERPRGP